MRQKISEKSHILEITTRTYNFDGLLVDWFIFDVQSPRHCRDPHCFPGPISEPKLHLPDGTDLHLPASWIQREMEMICNYWSFQRVINSYTGNPSVECNISSQKKTQASNEIKSQMPSASDQSGNLARPVSSRAKRRIDGSPLAKTLKDSICTFWAVTTIIFFETPCISKNND